ncbi:MAG: exonuclease SbcCD subunit D [Spirochaetota bacterium]
MTLIHTGDLHLGKTLHERSLEDEQRHFLAALLGVAVERRASALLIAGDIYDRAIPSPEAITLFSDFLERLVEACPAIVVVIIPGNHDSASRLAFGAGLLRRAGVHVRTSAAKVEPVILEGFSAGGPSAGGPSAASPSAAGPSERCAIWALPFLGGGAYLGDGDSADENATMRTQAEAFTTSVGRIAQRLEAGSRNILVAHCFASGAATSDSERAFVGLSEEVDARLFDPFDYAALGHLHRHQAAGAKGCYPGAPLAYSFGEAGSAKGFVVIELEGEGEGAGMRREFVAHQPLHRLFRLSASFDELCVPGAFPEHRDDLLEITLTDAVPVLDASERLRGNFPNLLSLRQSAFEISLAGQGGRIEFDAARDPLDQKRLEDDFILFHRELRDGTNPDEATLELVRELAREAADATN